VDMDIRDKLLFTLVNKLATNCIGIQLDEPELFFSTHPIL